MSIKNPTLASAITRVVTTTAIASASHTPGTGDFLVAVAYVHTAGATLFTDTATCAGNTQTWTKRQGQLSADGKQYLVAFTAGPVSGGTAGATTITVNTNVTEGQIMVWNTARAGASPGTVDATTPYVTSQKGVFTAGTTQSKAITAPSDPSNGLFVFWAHLKNEVTTPGANYTELGDSGTAPATATASALEGQYVIASAVETTSASWVTSSVSAVIIIEVKNGKALAADGVGTASDRDDLADTSVTPGNANSGINVAGEFIYNQFPADRYGHWG